MQNLDSNHIIRVHEFISNTQEEAFVMELVQGTTLANRIKTGPRLQNHDILNIMSGLLQTLSYVHRFPLIHYDIKPENIFITETGTVKLGGFGISKDLSPDAPNLTTTQSGIMGTLRYMSPEQFDHRNSITYKTDLYSAGVVLWEMVTGKKAHDYPLPSTGNETWDNIIGQATHKHIGERFKCANSFLETMQEAFETTPVYASNNRAIRPSKNEKQNIGFYLMVGSTVILLLLAVIWKNSKNHSDDSGLGYEIVDSTATNQVDTTTPSMGEVPDESFGPGKKDAGVNKIEKVPTLKK
jgi:serine/threonine protein kinase